MAIRFNIKPSVDFKSFQVSSQEIMSLIGDNIIANIKEKNKAGLDVDGNPHKAYSSRPIFMRTRFDSTKGKKGRQETFGKRFRPQRRDKLSGSQRLFVDAGGIGRPAIGAPGPRSDSLKSIRSIKVYEPAPRTLDANGNPQETKFYMGGYKQYKQDVFGDDTVNHRNTGRTMKSIRNLAKSSKKVKVFISKKLEAEAGMRNLVEHKRKWWGIGDQVKMAVRQIKRTIRFKKRFFGSGGNKRLVNKVDRNK